MADARPYDLVLFGATGFTGGLIAHYLARRLADGRIRWALAGRSREKLSKLRRELEREDPRMAELGLIEATSDDPESLRAMAGSTRAIITTVGPYQQHGEPLVAACVDQVCDYFDLTGEPSWWRSIVERYHERARARDVILVPCCGFESVPHDLGALFTAHQLPRDQPMTIDCYVSAKGTFSGGTLASALGEMPKGVKRGAGGGGGPRGPKQAKPKLHFVDALGVWAVPAPTIEPLVVRRSASLVPDFGGELQFREYFAFRSALTMAKTIVGLGGVAALASFAPTRRLLQRIRPQGTGPSPEARARAWFRIDFVGRAAGREVRTHVSGGDPGYDETAKMISEAAITAIEDRERLPLRGVLTPASALGMPLIERLRAAGIEFAVD
ncbi:saccharopine dehydrogenase family protein [Nannocystaceae bacterium ST9]